ncbi:MAG: hypothetical protein GY913_18575 [Proteobacteria bacterium]|nr:hypothetical protein [Pseudomonadota bacterium]MCP4918916.1 hypothetical protein [Pseudomonadota bacterium]
MKPTRRNLLLGTGALAVVAGVIVAVGHRPMPSADSPFLGSSARQTLEAALDALVPIEGKSAALAAGVDAFLAGDDPLLGAELRLALTALEHGGLRRFSRLDLAGRTERLAAWESSSINTKRQIFQALRRVAMFSWYTSSESWEAIGYDGPWV